MTVFKFALLRNIKSPISFFASLIAPITLMFLFPNVWIYNPVGNVAVLVYLMVLSAHLLAGLMLEDKIDGSVMKIYLSPVSTVSYIFQNLLSAIMPIIVQIVILGILGIVRYNWETELLVGILITLLIFAIANTAFSFFWNMLFKSKAASRNSIILVAAVMLILSGIMVPIEALPGIMQYVGAIFHPYWLMRALTTLAVDGLTSSFWIYQGVMLLFATAFLLLGGRRRTI